MQSSQLTKDRYKAKTLAELESLEKKMGYKFGWARAVYAARTKKQSNKRKNNV
jgi:hypothetical protein